VFIFTFKTDKTLTISQHGAVFPKYDIIQQTFP